MRHGLRTLLKAADPRALALVGRPAADVVVEGLTGLGIQEDANGRMWIAIYPWGGTVGAWGLDVETMEQVGLIDLTSYTAQSRGLSVDFEGNIWVVEQGARAFRVNPNDQTTEIRNLLYECADDAVRFGAASPGDLIAIVAGLSDMGLGTNLFEVHRAPYLAR